MWVTIRVTDELLELYARYLKRWKWFSFSVGRPSRRRAWGTLYSGAPGYSVKHGDYSHTPWFPTDIGAAAPCWDRVSAGRHGPLCPGQGFSARLALSLRAARVSGYRGDISRPRLSRGTSPCPCFAPCQKEHVSWSGITFIRLNRVTCC